MPEKISTASVRDNVTEEEWNLRVDLAAAYRLVADMGWEDLIFTHLSVRIPGPEHRFLINPYGLLFDEVNASNLVKIDVEGKIILDNGFPVNPAGFTIHSAIHMAREDALCVMHVHTVDGNAVSTMAEGLLPLTQTALTVWGDIAYHDYEGIAFDHKERPRLQADIGDKKLMMLRNHGTLAVGETVAAAFLRLYFLERACSIQVRSLAANCEFKLPSQEAIDKVAQQVGNFDVAGDLLWPALLRKLDRIDPSFRD